MGGGFRRNDHLHPCPAAGLLAPPWRAQFGALLAGWGVFNVVEGLIDHQILGVHHVRDDLGGPLGWDISFLVFGALLVVVGWALIASARPAGLERPAAQASVS